MLFLLMVPALVLAQPKTDEARLDETKVLALADAQIFEVVAPPK